MIGVLMTGAHAGQRRPGRTEPADLIWGALRIRLHPVRAGSADPHWRDALAVVSVVLPLVFVVYLAALDLSSLGFLAGLSPDKALSDAFVQSDAQSLGSWIILLALALALALAALRLRRAAAPGASAMLIWAAVSTAGVPNWSYIDPHSMLVFVVLGLEIAALAASPGPRRGLQLLTWKHYALVAVVAATPAVAINWLWPSRPAVGAAIVITVIAGTLAAMTLASPRGRRIVVLLSGPAYYLIVGLVVMPLMIGGPYEFASGWVGSLRVTLTCLPLAAVACLAGVAALRSGHRHVPADASARRVR